jgi:predicted dehydrogenase
MGLRHLEIASTTGLAVVGVADPREGAREQARTRFGVGADICHADAGKMLDHVHAECVIVASTAPSHSELTCRAAAAGASHILCEKPMAVSLAQCDAMIAACAATGAKLAINHQMRFMEQYRRPKAIIGSAEFGELGSILVAAGNFGLAMNGSHYVEMFHFITGEPAIKVNAQFSKESVPNPRGAEFVDCAGSIRLESVSGKRFYLDAGSDQGHGIQVVYSGRHGRITIDELTGRMQIVVRDSEHRAKPTTAYGMPCTTRDVSIAPTDALEPSRAVLTALLNGQDYPDGAAGRRAVEVLTACYLSNERDGTTIHLGREVLPRERMFPWA